MFVIGRLVPPFDPFHHRSVREREVLEPVKTLDRLRLDLTAELDR